MVEILVIVGVVAIITPIVVYFSIKLGAYAFIKGMHLAEREMKNPEDEVQ